MRLARAAAILISTLALGIAMGACGESDEQDSAAAVTTQPQTYTPPEGHTKDGPTGDPSLDRKLAELPLGASVEEVEAELTGPEGSQTRGTGPKRVEKLFYGQWELTFVGDELTAKKKWAGG